MSHHQRWAWVNELETFESFPLTLKTSEMNFPDPVDIENVQEHCQTPSELGDTTM